MTDLDDTEISAFIERVRAERRAEGRPEHLTGPSIYGLVDGLLAAQADEPVERAS